MRYVVSRFNNDVMTIGLPDGALDFLAVRFEVFRFTEEEADIPAEIIHAYYYKDGTVKYFTRWGKIKVVNDDKRDKVGSAIKSYLSEHVVTNEFLQYYKHI